MRLRELKEARLHPYVPSMEEEQAVVKESRELGELTDEERARVSKSGLRTDSSLGSMKRQTERP